MAKFAQIIFSIVFGAFFSLAVLADNEPVPLSAPPITSIDQPNTSSTWNFIVIPYLWAPWTNGSATIKNLTTSINATPSDLANNLAGAGEIHIEARKNPWSFIVDPTYLKLATDLPNKSIHEESKFIVSDFAVGYRALTLRNDNTNNFLDIDLLVDARYWDLSAELTIPQLSLTRSGGESWVDPVVGARAIYTLGEKWLFSLYADVGGFGLSSQSTWQTRLDADYKFNKYFGIIAGFRALGIDHSRSNWREFQIKTTQFGPELGLAFTF